MDICEIYYCAFELGCKYKPVAACIYHGKLNKQKYGISEYKHEFSLNFYKNYGKKGIMEL